MNQSTEQLYSKLSFLEISLFFSITFQRETNQKILFKEALENFKSFMKISDSELSYDCARVKYGRMNIKMKKILKANDVTKGLFLSDYKEMIESAEDLLIEIKENLKNGKIVKG